MVQLVCYKEFIMVITQREIDLLFNLLTRAGVTQIEAIWTIQIYDKLCLVAKMFSEQQNPAPVDVAELTPDAS